MRRRGWVLVVGALLLAGCGADDGDPEPTPSEPSSQATSIEPTSPPEETESATTQEPVEADAVQLCSDYIEGASQPVPAEGGEGIVDAVTSAELPEGAQLISTQVLYSTDVEGGFEAVVNVCAEPLDFVGAVDVGDAVAATLLETPTQSLYINTWYPADGSVAAGEGVQTSIPDYQSDTESLALGSNWS